MNIVVKRFIGALVLILGPAAYGPVSLLWRDIHGADMHVTYPTPVASIIAMMIYGIAFGIALWISTLISYGVIAHVGARSVLSRWALSTLVTTLLLGGFTTAVLSGMDAGTPGYRFLWQVFPQIAPLFTVGYAPFGFVYWLLQRGDHDLSAPNPPKATP